MSGSSSSWTSSISISSWCGSRGHSHFPGSHTGAQDAELGACATKARRRSGPAHFGCAPSHSFHAFHKASSSSISCAGLPGAPSLQGVDSDQDSEAQWISMMKAALDTSRPELHAGFESGGGHLQGRLLLRTAPTTREEGTGSTLRRWRLRGAAHHRQGRPQRTHHRGTMKAALPVVLDNRGIAPGVAFLRYTSGAYAALPQAPSLAELEVAITHSHPAAGTVRPWPTERLHRRGGRAGGERRADDPPQADRSGFTDRRGDGSPDRCACRLRK